MLLLTVCLRVIVCPAAFFAGVLCPSNDNTEHRRRRLFLLSVSSTFADVCPFLSFFSQPSSPAYSARRTVTRRCRLFLLSLVSMFADFGLFYFSRCSLRVPRTAPVQRKTRMRRLLCYFPSLFVDVCLLHFSMSQPSSPAYSVSVVPPLMYVWPASLIVVLLLIVCFFSLSFRSLRVPRTAPVQRNQQGGAEYISSPIIMFH